MSAMVPPMDPPAGVGVKPSGAGAPALAAARVGGVLRVMFWKEVRELAPWAGLAGMGLALALSFVLYEAANMERGSRWNGNWDDTSIVGTNFGLVTVFLIPIVALLMGFMQFIRESKPDRFAFLVHRPSGRSVLFLAKIVPGIAVYLAATVVPLGLAILWAKDPHHMPYPFRWEMALPSVADVCVGLAYYFAGVLVARRTEARWWGSRLLPIAAAVVATGLNYGAREFYWAMLTNALAAGVFLVAARGAFLGGGQYFPQSRMAKGALGVVLGVAVLIVGTAGAALLVELTQQPSGMYENANVIFLTDGTPVVENYEMGRATRMAELGGKVIAEAGSPDWDRVQRQHLSVMPLNGGKEGNSGFYPFRFPARFFVYSFSIGHEVLWYRPAEGNYLVGYDLRNHALVGSIGPEGFAPMKAVPPVRFKAPVTVVMRPSSALIACGDTVYRFSEGYRLEKYFTTPDHGTIVKLGLVGKGRSDPETEKIVRWAMATEEQIWVVAEMEPGKVLAHVNHAKNTNYDVTVGYLAEGRGYLFDFSPIRYAPVHAKGPREAVYVAEDGIERVVPLPENAYTYRGRHSSMEQYVEVLSPPLAVIGGGALEWLFGGGGFAGGVSEFLHFLGNCSAVALVTAGIIFAVGGWLAMPLRARWFWTVVGLLLGPAGLVLLFCVRPMEHRVACAECGRKRLVTEAVCGRCGAEFARPKATGTEIFA